MKQTTEQNQKAIEELEKVLLRKIAVKDGNVLIPGYLDISYTGITSLPDNLTLGDSLDISYTGITSLPDNLTVGGYLDLRGTNITSLPDNLTVGGYLDLSGTGITSLPDNLTVGGSLYLRGTNITSLPDNLTVGGYLDLRGTNITSLPDNLTVGGSLYLGGTNITSLPDNLTVGGSLDISYTGVTDTSNVRRVLSEKQKQLIRRQNNPYLSWRNERYIKIDDIFTEVISHRGHIYKVRKIGNNDIGYIVTDGEGNYAHGDTLEEAKQDLLYKISNRDKSSYKNLTLDSVLSFDDAVICYRVITGACSAGTRDYLHNRLPQPHKDTYSIREIIELTQNEYGGKAFHDFFYNSQKQ